MPKTYKKIKTQPFTLASGTTSEVIELNDRSLFAIMTPASISSVAMTFTASNTKAGTYVAVEGDDGVAISITIESSKFVAFNNKHLALRACPYLKCVLGASETDKTFILFFIEE
jgi:hypothetical protein